MSADKFRGYASSLLWADEIVAWKKEPIAVLDECYRVSRFQTARMRRCGALAARAHHHHAEADADLSVTSSRSTGTGW